MLAGLLLPQPALAATECEFEPTAWPDGQSVTPDVRVVWNASYAEVHGELVLVHDLDAADPVELDVSRLTNDSEDRFADRTAWYLGVPARPLAPGEWRLVSRSGDEGIGGAGGASWSEGDECKHGPSADSCEPARFFVRDQSASTREVPVVESERAYSAGALFEMAEPGFYVASKSRSSDDFVLGRDRVDLVFANRFALRTYYDECNAGLTGDPGEKVTLHFAALSLDGRPMEWSEPHEFTIPARTSDCSLSSSIPSSGAHLALAGLGALAVLLSRRRFVR